MTKRINVRLPERLVQETDTLAKVKHKNRTDMIKEAIYAYLCDHKEEEGFREEMTDLYLKGELSFEELEQVIGRRDAEAARSSKNILERGDEMADEMAGT